MNLKIRPITFRLIHIILILGITAITPVCDASIAFVANNNNQLGLEVETTFGVVDVPVAGHVALGFQRDDGKFVLGSFGPRSGWLPLWAPGSLTVEIFDDWPAVERYLISNYYTTYKTFYVDNPNSQDALNTMDRFSGSYYNLLSSVIDVKENPILAPLVGASPEHPDSENCLTFTKRVLEAYGVTDLPVIVPFINSAPNNYFLLIPGEVHSVISEIQQEESTTPASLSGVWKGTYYYSDARDPVGFSATITFNANRFYGTTQEPNTFGKSNVPYLYANIDGSVTGNSITFDKTYDGTGGSSHTVKYSGTLDENAGTISGTWTIPGSTAIGRFEMSLSLA